MYLHGQLLIHNSICCVIRNVTAKWCNSTDIFHLRTGVEKVSNLRPSGCCKTGMFRGRTCIRTDNPAQLKDTGKEGMDTSLRKFDSSDFGYYELGGYDLGDCELITGISEFGGINLWRLQFWRLRALEVMVLEFFYTHPISMTSRTGVDTVIQPSCSMCITRFHQNISKI